MKKLAGVTLLVCACLGMAFAQTDTPSAATSAKAPSTSQAVKQLEHDWVDAMKAADSDKLLARSSPTIGLPSATPAARKPSRVFWPT